MCVWFSSHSKALHTQSCKCPKTTPPPPKKKKRKKSVHQHTVTTRVHTQQEMTYIKRSHDTETCQSIITSLAWPQKEWSAPEQVTMRPLQSLLECFSWVATVPDSFPSPLPKWNDLNAVEPLVRDHLIKDHPSFNITFFFFFCFLPFLSTFQGKWTPNQGPLLF